VLTGGWQTSKETAYVEATRARHGTDWFVARDDLGDARQDARRIERLAQKMTNSRAPRRSRILTGSTQLDAEPQSSTAPLCPLADALADSRTQP
jgi:hypothetical protein